MRYYKVIENGVVKMIGSKAVLTEKETEIHSHSDQYNLLEQLATKLAWPFLS